jgi:DNA-binding response OmpR family regulator
MVEKARVLVVDDELSIRLLLTEELSQEGYEVSTAASGAEALAMLHNATFDLVLLDLKMPGIDGLQVMKEAHSLAPDTVVIMLTAYSTLDSAIEAVRQGAHDYLIKPSSTEEILASLEKGLAKRRHHLLQQDLIRRIEHTAHQLRSGEIGEPVDESGLPDRHRTLQVRDLLLDRDGLTATLHDYPLNLTPTEFRLLRCLMENADRTMSFVELAEAVHGVGTDEILAREAMSTHMWRLRKKLSSAAPDETYVVNVRGRGYKLPTE